MWKHGFVPVLLAATVCGAVAMHPQENSARPFDQARSVSDADSFEIPAAQFQPDPKLQPQAFAEPPPAAVRPNAPEDALRRQILSVLEEQISVMTAEELQAMKSRVDGELLETMARAKVRQARQILETVCIEFPGTEATQQARAMLQAADSPDWGPAESGNSPQQLDFQPPKLQKDAPVGTNQSKPVYRDYEKRS